MSNSLKFSVFFHTLVILAFATLSIPIYLLLGMTTVYAITVNYNSFYKLNEIEFPAIIIYFGSIVLMTMVNFFFEPIVAYHLFIGAITMLSAVIFTRDSKVYYYSSKITLIFFQVIALLYVVYTGLGDFPVKVPYEDMIKGASANGITSYAVLLQVNLSMMRLLLFRKAAIFTSVLTLIIALLGYGRGSIIAAFLILLLNVFTSFAIKSQLKFFLYIMVTSLIAIFVIGYYFDEIYFFLEANTKLSAGMVDTSRAKIIREYLDQMNPLSLFTGADYTHTSIITEFNGNPHNSFIRAHHIFGLPYLLFVVIFPFYCIFQRKKVIELFFCSFSVVILFFRVFSEPIIFPTIFDFYFFSMFLMIAKTKGPLIERT